MFDNASHCNDMSVKRISNKLKSSRVTTRYLIKTLERISSELVRIDSIKHRVDKANSVKKLSSDVVKILPQFDYNVVKSLSVYTGNKLDDLRGKK